MSSVAGDVRAHALLRGDPVAAVATADATAEAMAEEVASGRERLSAQGRS